MSQTQEIAMATKKLGPIKFAPDHRRISPLSSDEVLRLEPHEIYKIVRNLKDNVDIMRQISRYWQRQIGLVEKYQPGDYIPDEVIDAWGEFISRILITQEDRWQQLRQLCLEVITASPALQTYQRRRANLGEHAELLSLPIHDLQEASRWLEVAGYIMSHPLYQKFVVKSKLEPLEHYGIVGLHKLRKQLDSYSSRVELAEKIRAVPNYRELMSTHPNPAYQRLATKRLEDGIEQDLAGFYDEMTKSAEAGVYFVGKELIAMPPPQVE